MLLPSSSECTYTGHYDGSVTSTDGFVCFVSSRKQNDFTEKENRQRTIGFAVGSDTFMFEKTGLLVRGFHRKQLSTESSFLLSFPSFSLRCVYTLQRSWKENVFLPTWKRNVLLVCVSLRRVWFRVTFDRKKLFFSEQNMKVSNLLERERKELFHSALSKRCCSLQQNHR